jgi:glycosyltransferase involved in cell wall biosynthesis
MKLPVTVIILAHEENKKLAAAVHSVEWAAEVKVVHLNEPISDFSAVRNAAMENAQYDWVFFLDSDEVCMSTVESVQLLISRADIDGVYVKRRDIFLGKELQWGEVRNIHLLRLFKKEKGRFVRPVHEVVELDGKAVHSDILLHHYAHDSVASFLSKVTKYAQIEAELRVKRKESFSLLQLLVWPKAKFLFNYGVQLGFLDGWRGLIYAIMMSIHSFAVRAFLYEKHSRH